MSYAILRVGAQVSNDLYLSGFEKKEEHNGVSLTKNHKEVFWG